MNPRHVRDSDAHIGYKYPQAERPHYGGEESFGQAGMNSRQTHKPRFRSRRDAERALADILASGGKVTEYRIDEDADGSCVITIFEREGGPVAGHVGV